MKCSVVSFSLSKPFSTITEWSNHLIQEIYSLTQQGAEIILYPELFLLDLCQFFPGDNEQKMKQVATYTKDQLLPDIKNSFNNNNIFLCLGSGPNIVNNKIYNTSFNLINNQWFEQSKLHLTPWETNFTPGDTLSVFSCKNLKIVVLICYDIELPSLSLKLKQENINLILVPCATNNTNGNQRINRCATARSVELGAAVLTCPLIGDSSFDLIDHNEGRQGFFMPSQDHVQLPQESFSTYSVSESIIQSYELQSTLLKQLKIHDDETKPYLKNDNLKIKIHHF